MHCSRKGMAGTLKGLVTLHLSQEARRAQRAVTNTEESMGVFNGNRARGVWRVKWSGLEHVSKE